MCVCVCVCVCACAYACACVRACALACVNQTKLALRNIILTKTLKTHDNLINNPNAERDLRQASHLQLLYDINRAVYHCQIKHFYKLF